MAKAKPKSAYTKFREIAKNYEDYLGLAKSVQKNEVVPGIHNLAAGILKKKGLDDLALELMKTSERPDNHALFGIMQTGVDIFGEEYNDFGKAKLSAIVNSDDLKLDKVKDALLLLPPKKEVKGHKPLSEVHKDASEFYMDLYLYQQNGKLSDEQKEALKNNMSVRVINEYKDRFKDDKEFFSRVGALIQGYEKVAIAQYKTLTDAKVKVFGDQLKNSNAGKYVKAMNLSDKNRALFFQVLLE